MVVAEILVYFLTLRMCLVYLSPMSHIGASTTHANAVLCISLLGGTIMSPVSITLSISDASRLDQLSLLTL